MTRIYDTIHGFIEITPLMKKFMDTEEFQRLRDLKPRINGAISEVREIIKEVPCETPLVIPEKKTIKCCCETVCENRCDSCSSTSI